MCALAVLKKGLLRMSDTFESGCMSSTTKSTSTKKSLILMECSLQYPYDIGLIDRPVINTLILAWALKFWVCIRQLWASHWHLFQGHKVYYWNVDLQLSNQ
jgi:hypothetical protein